MNLNANRGTAPELRCLLCNNDALRKIWTLTGADVRKLWQAAGRQLSEEAFGSLSSGQDVSQFECCVCGFRFFDPSLAGSGRFYEELEERDYYVPRRCEFDFALDLCRRAHAKSVLDIGGGEGAFLDSARAAGLATFALELNEKAAAVCARKGHIVLNSRLEQVSTADLAGGVDVVTMFQVIEHVPDPCGFLRQASSLVKPGGLVVLAVPNDAGQHRLLPFDPANMPPHHVSRWRMRDLESLGKACGLTKVTADGDVLYGDGVAGFWLVHNRLAVAIGRPPHPGGEWLPHLLSFMYRKLGCRYYFPRKGLSIYVAYRKP